ncbi:Uncharacterised protein [Yersinia aleksiciae]|uniref:Uncharacterized protein n=1 Tax=Yersinia aleksiciae TaxID=263819 RepID=A0A0T9UB15_YERAE|nr:Uncharacterised protein [Yersinia aleksiciae]
MVAHITGNALLVGLYLYLILEHMVMLATMMLHLYRMQYYGRRRIASLWPAGFEIP